MNCPKCGADYVGLTYTTFPCKGLRLWQCGSSEHISGKIMCSEMCYERQLASVTVERDVLLEACHESLIVLALSNSQIVDPRHAIILVESAIAKCEGGE